MNTDRLPSTGGLLTRTPVGEHGPPRDTTAGIVAVSKCARPESRDVNGDHPTGGSGERERIGREASGDESAFVSLTGHFYRGEVERMTAWRTRLDQTTNWSVVLMAAILTFAFASPDNPHYVLLIGALAVGAFLLIESQRYQEYDAWRHRVRILQRGFFASVLAPSEDGRTDRWRADLGADLRDPTLSIPLWRAVAHRLQRTYLPLLSVLLAAWVLRISVFEADSPWQETASVATIPGPAVVATVGATYLVVVGLAAWSMRDEPKREFGSSDSGGGD